MKKFFLTLTAFLFVIQGSYACFDTYLFLHKRSMVYPHKALLLEWMGEYSINRIKTPQSDNFISYGSIYYGAGENFSIQFSIGSDEKQRDALKVDVFGIRGVLNAYSSAVHGYNLDLAVEYRGGFNGNRSEIEVSIPNIFHFSNLTYIFHPGISYGLLDDNLQAGAHTGLFYNFNETSIIGIGAEYASPQSSSYAGNRIVDGEIAASIFIGAKIGSLLYVQNEFAKGLSNSRDFGFAVTAKFLLN